MELIRNFDTPAHAVDWYRETVEEYNATNASNFAPSPFAEHIIHKNCRKMNLHGDELDEVAEWVHVKVDAEVSADYDGDPPSAQEELNREYAIAMSAHTPQSKHTQHLSLIHI